MSLMRNFTVLTVSESQKFASPQEPQKGKYLGTFMYCTVQSFLSTIVEQSPGVMIHLGTVVMSDTNSQTV
jgi:hypothetical protein